MASRTPAAPAGLGSRAKRLWREMHKQWDLDADELEILSLACEAVDRAQKAQTILIAEGVTTTDRFGQVKPHPAAEVRATAENSAARLLKQLGTHAEGERALRNNQIRSGVVRSIHRKRRPA